MINRYGIYAFGSTQETIGVLFFFFFLFYLADEPSVILWQHFLIVHRAQKHSRNKYRRQFGIAQCS